MNRKIAALLAIALLISLTGCGGNSAGNGVPPSNSIESSQAPTETPETPTEPTTEPTATPSTEPTTALTQEPTAEPTEEPEETIPTNEKPTTEITQKPTTPPATSTPAPVTPSPSSAPVAQTPPPQTHTHSYTVTTKATCTSEGIETCSCGDTKVIPATGQHDYQPQTIQGTGHMEQVQVGTEQVLVRNDKVQYKECMACGIHIYTDAEWDAHTNPQSSSFSANCAFSRYLIQTEYIPVYEEQPKYENQWVIDTPDQTIYKCSVCGQEK